MHPSECRAGVVVEHAETGAHGVILRGGYRPRVQWFLNWRVVRTEETLLRFVAPDEITYRRGKTTMTVHDRVGRPLQVGNVVSDNDNTAWMISEIQIRDRGEDPCGYVVGDHNDLTDIFPVRYTEGGAMCFGVRFVREKL